MIAFVKSAVTDAQSIAGWFYGPAGKRYTIVGETPAGESIGWAEVGAQELAILSSAVHRDQYITDSWQGLFNSMHRDAVDWVVAVEDPADPSVTVWKPLSQAEADGDTFIVTPSGVRKYRSPGDEVDIDVEREDATEAVQNLRMLRLRPVPIDQLPAPGPGVIGSIAMAEEASGMQRLAVCRVNSSGDPGWDDAFTGTRLLP